MSKIFFDETDAETLVKTEEGKKEDGVKISRLKEHLYMTYLIVGTIAFSFGILISYKRLKNGN